jgi:hypothetical protein
MTMSNLDTSMLEADFQDERTSIPRSVPKSINCRRSRTTSSIESPRSFVNTTKSRHGETRYLTRISNKAARVPTQRGEMDHQLSSRAESSDRSERPRKPTAARTLGGRIGAYRRWARTSDWTAATAPAREAFMGRFEREVDPDGVLPERERAQRAQAARRAYYAELALKSLAARRKRAPKK